MSFLRAEASSRLFHPRRTDEGYDPCYFLPNKQSYIKCTFIPPTQYSFFSFLKWTSQERKLLQITKAQCLKCDLLLFTLFRCAIYRSFWKLRVAWNQFHRSNDYFGGTQSCHCDFFSKSEIGNRPAFAQRQRRGGNLSFQPAISYRNARPMTLAVVILALRYSFFVSWR